MAIIRRFDCLLANTKDTVIEMAKNDVPPAILATIGHGFYKKFKFDFEKLLDDPDNMRSNFESYILGFSSNTREIVENFEFGNEKKT